MYAMHTRYLGTQFTADTATHVHLQTHFDNQGFFEVVYIPLVEIALGITIITVMGQTVITSRPLGEQIKGKTALIFFQNEHFSGTSARLVDVTTHQVAKAVTSTQVAELIVPNIVYQKAFFEYIHQHTCIHCKMPYMHYHKHTVGKTHTQHPNQCPNNKCKNYFLNDHFTGAEKALPYTFTDSTNGVRYNVPLVDHEEQPTTQPTTQTNTIELDTVNANDLDDDKYDGAGLAIAIENELDNNDTIYKSNCDACEEEGYSVQHDKVLQLSCVHKLCERHEIIMMRCKSVAKTSHPYCPICAVKFIENPPCIKSLNEENHQCKQDSSCKEKPYTLEGNLAYLSKKLDIFMDDIGFATHVTKGIKGKLKLNTMNTNPHNDCAVLRLIFEQSNLIDAYRAVPIKDSKLSKFFGVVVDVGTSARMIKTMLPMRMLHPEIGRDDYNRKLAIAQAREIAKSEESPGLYLPITLQEYIKTNVEKYTIFNFTDSIYYFTYKELSDAFMTRQDGLVAVGSCHIYMQDGDIIAGTKKVGKVELDKITKQMVMHVSGNPNTYRHNCPFPELSHQTQHDFYTNETHTFSVQEIERVNLTSTCYIRFHIVKIPNRHITAQIHVPKTLCTICDTPIDGPCATTNMHNTKITCTTTICNECLLKITPKQMEKCLRCMCPTTWLLPSTPTGQLLNTQLEEYRQGREEIIPDEPRTIVVGRQATTQQGEPTIQPRLGHMYTTKKQQVTKPPQLDYEEPYQILTATGQYSVLLPFKGSTKVRYYKTIPTEFKITDSETWQTLQTVTETYTFTIPLETIQKCLRCTFAPKNFSKDILFEMTKILMTDAAKIDLPVEYIPIVIEYIIAKQVKLMADIVTIEDSRLFHTLSQFVNRKLDSKPMGCFRKWCSTFKFNTHRLQDISKNIDVKKEEGQVLHELTKCTRSNPIVKSEIFKNERNQQPPIQQSATPTVAQPTNNVTETDVLMDKPKSFKQKCSLKLSPLKCIGMTLTKCCSNITKLFKKSRNNKDKPTITTNQVSDDSIGFDYDTNNSINDVSSRDSSTHNTNLFTTSGGALLSK